MADGRFDIAWRDSGKEPRCPANPAYPDGIDLDFSMGAANACTVALPHPARRIGAWFLKCRICAATVACTTAGRPDDPRSAKVPCRPMSRA